MDERKEDIISFTISAMPVAWFKEFKEYCLEYTNDSYSHAIKNLLEDRKKLLKLLELVKKDE